MNKKLIITCAISASAVMASTQAQDLLAGWDFTNASGTDTTVGATRSYFGDLFGAEARGTFSTGLEAEASLENGFNADIFWGSGGVDANKGIDFLDDNGVIRLPGAELGDGTALIFDNSANGGTFTFAFNGDGSTAFDFDSFTYGAGIANGGTGTLTWEYDTGSGFNSLGAIGVSASVPGGEEESVSLTGLSGETITIRGTVSGISNPTQLYLDNFQIGGSVVPEPSAYSAIFGLMALAFVANRRRRK